MADILNDDPVEEPGKPNCAYDDSQCGGTNPGTENPWTGPTCCTGRSRCVAGNRFFSKCVPPADQGGDDEPGGDADTIIPSASELAPEEEEEEESVVPAPSPATTTTAAADQRQQQSAAAAPATAAADEVAKPSTESCHDAVPGETCWQEVTWAKNSGIREHPDWYPGLSTLSTEAEFQAVVHSATPNKCPAPCAGVAVSSCRDPTPGDACWGAVDWAKKHGIHEHPEWYPGLSSASSDADFQAQVHSAEPSKCPVPCGAGAQGNAAAAASPAAPQGPSCATYGCGGRYIQSRSCQCNRHCSRHGNCCSDYAAKCSR